LALQAFLLIGVCVFSIPTQAKYGGGTGEPNDPYQVYTAEQMNAIGADPNDWDKHFKLMADIDLAAYTGTDFNIIGNQAFPFVGVFDGNGKKIFNFSYTSTGGGNIGLFEYVSGANAQIKDLGLIDPNVDTGTGDHVGSLVGMLSGGTVDNCYVQGGSVSGGRDVGGLVGWNSGDVINCYSTGTVNGDTSVGGLVGYDYRGVITNCYSTGSVSGREIVGGLSGSNGGIITNCYSTGSVSGQDGVGGLVGSNSFFGGTITNSYSNGTVSGNQNVGGLAGTNDRLGTIANCYSTGSVSGQGGVGGLVGSNSDTIINCYSVGSVTGTTDVGGLVGLNDGDTVTDSFWDTQTSGQTTSAGGTGLTTAEMQTESTFIVWGGDRVWTIDEGIDYPRLWWENKPGKLITKPPPTYWEGSGTKDDPFLIYTAEQLNTIGSVRCEWDKHFKLMADIDLSDFVDTDFNIIGNQAFPFTGVFDGNGKKILNLNSYTTPAPRDNIGLFGYIDDPKAQIKDLRLIEPTTVSVHSLSQGTIANCHVEGGSASLVFDNSGTIINCTSSASGSTSLDRHNYGGLVAVNSGRIINCHLSGDVSGARFHGGLVGTNRGVIINCSSSGSVPGGTHVGGLVGRNRGGIISNSYSSSDVSGSGYDTGGLVGENRDGIIANCYATGSVTEIRPEYVTTGGLVGRNTGTISNCYSAGSVTGTTDVGGLVGLWEVGAIEESFWDIESSGQTFSDGGRGRTTAEMQTTSTFLEAGWDFINIWGIGENQTYPYLRKYSAADISQDGIINFADLTVLADNWLAGIAP
jgi:hypothetical protein